jgi:iron-sulfur cluster repair protein YtfE (RIC family)
MTANNGTLQEVRRVISTLEKVLACRARAAEDLLFPTLDPHLGQKKPFTVMRTEHRKTNDLVEAMNREDDVDALNARTAGLLTLTTPGDQWAARRKVVIVGRDCMVAA